MTPAPEPRPALVDTHAHLDDLRDDLPGVLERARSSGVVQVIAIGTTAADSRSVVEIARDHPGVFATVGIHPNHAAEARPGDWGTVTALAAQPKVVAIGETGLDRHWDKTPFPQQQEWFDRHLALAEERGLPVVIHCRNCEKDIINQLARRQRPVRGVLHSFTGDWDDAQAFLDLGLHLSFAGMITFSNKSLDPLREAASKAPVDRILVETDSPYLSPHPHRGRPNEPGRVALTAEKVAQLRELSLGELCRITTQNARRLFSLTAEELA